MIEALKHQLADQMERLTIDLLGAPPTTRARDEIRFGAKGALAVRVAGSKRGSFCDYSGDAKGDAIALIRHVRRCDTRAAILWAQQWLGMAPSSLAPPKPDTSPPPTSVSPPRTAGLALRLWQESVSAQGTQVEAYLRWRGLTLEPDAPIRFHPCTWRNKANGPPGPAMLALMTCPQSGEPLGTHVTYLRSDGLGKAQGKCVKVMLGRSGIIRLVPDDEIGTGLGLAEGIETAISVMQGFGWRPVWCATSAGGLARFPALPNVQALTIFADQDPAGINAARACAKRWGEAKCVARILAPPVGDFNDLAREAAA